MRRPRGGGSRGGAAFMTRWVVSSRTRMKRLAAVLLAAGSLHWIFFFGVPPQVPREQADWPKEFRYYAALRQAAVEMRIPYFVSLPIQDTRKFLAIPEVVVSPQVLLLRFLSIDAFLVVHFVLL